MSEAENALDQSIGQFAQSTKSKLITEVFLRPEAPQGDELERFKISAGIWHLPESYINFYFKSALIGLDYRSFNRHISDASHTASLLPYQREADSSSMNFWAIEKIATSAAIFSLDGYCYQVDIAKTKIRPAGVATLLYLNEKSVGALPNDLEKFVQMSAISLVKRFIES